MHLTIMTVFKHASWTLTSYTTGRKQIVICPAWWIIFNKQRWLNMHEEVFKKNRSDKMWQIFLLTGLPRRHELKINPVTTFLHFLVKSNVYAQPSSLWVGNWFEYVVESEINDVSYVFNAEWCSAVNLADVRFMMQSSHTHTNAHYRWMHTHICQFYSISIGCGVTHS